MSQAFLLVRFGGMKTQRRLGNSRGDHPRASPQSSPRRLLKILIGRRCLERSQGHIDELATADRAEPNATRIGYGHLPSHSFGTAHTAVASALGMNID